MTQLRHYFSLLIFTYIFILTESKPISTSTKDNINETELLNYLTKYGYLLEKRHNLDNNTYRRINGTNSSIPHNKTNPYAKQELQLAILDFQKFMGIPITGSLDAKTMATMKKPRCGEPDRIATDFSRLTLKAFLTPRGKRKRRNALQYFSRNKYAQGVTYDWYVNPKYRSKTMPLLKRYIIEYGINLWATVSNVKFQNREGWNYADIIFSFHSYNHGHGQPFDGKGGVLAHASSTTKEVHFDDDEDWKTNQIHLAYFVRPGISPDFIQTAAHEMGHVLGLTHSSKNTSVMYPSIEPGIPGAEYSLDPEDVVRIQATYGRCWPDHIDSIFSDLRGDGRTYLIVGPFIYLFDNQKIQVSSENWPRATYHFFTKGFQLIDDIFHGESRDNNRLYYFWTKWYYFDIWGDLSPGWWNINKNDRGTYKGILGWPGLHDKIDKIDAGFKHIDGKVYIFRKDKVYRWDYSAKSPVTPHFPEGQLEVGWPKLISEVFPGVPNDIDTVFRWNYDGNVYFFKGKYFYIWNQKLNKAIGTYSTDQWKNVCDVVKCTGGAKCRSWELTTDNCGDMCKG